MKHPTEYGESPISMVFDTETTGLPSKDRKVRADPLSWPRLVQVGWVLCHQDRSIIHEQEFIAYPQGFEIPDAACTIHGISTSRARDEGMPVDLVLDEFCAAAQQADILVAHNLSYDIRILLSELIRRNKRSLLPKKPGICTMRSSARFCGMPGRFGKGFRYPSLSMLYSRLFDTRQTDAHQALADARACAACYHELHRKGVKMEMETKIHNFFPDR